MNSDTLALLTFGGLLFVLARTLRAWGRMLPGRAGRTDAPLRRARLLGRSS